MEVKSDQPVQAEIEVPGAYIRLVQLPVEHEYHSHGVLRDCVGGVSRHPDYADLSGGGFQGYVVVSGAAHCDYFHAALRQRVDGGFPEVVVHERADCAAALRQPDGFRPEPALKVLYLEILVQLVEPRPVVGLRIKKCDLFHGTSPSYALIFCAVPAIIPGDSR